MQNIKTTLYRILSVVFYEHAFMFLSVIYFITAYTRTNSSDMFPLLGIAAIMSALYTIMSQLRELNQYNDEKHIAEIERNHQKNMDLLNKLDESLNNIKSETEEK